VVVVAIHNQVRVRVLMRNLSPTKLDEVGRGNG
jgi:hypothetical protein